MAPGNDNQTRSAIPNRYHVLLENAGYALLRFDRDGVLLAVDPGIEQITEQPAADLIGQPCCHFIASDDRPLARPFFEQPVARFPMETAYRVRTASGDLRRVRHLAIGPGEAALQRAPEASDANLQAALESSEDHNRALMRAIPDLLLLMHRDGSYQEFSPLRQQADTRNIYDFGLDDATLTQVITAMETAITSGEIQTIYYDEKGDDARRAFEARITPHSADEVLVMVRDISDLRQAQRQLAERVEQLEILHQVDQELSQVLSVEYVLTMALDAAMRLSAASSAYIGLAQDDGTMRLARVMGDHTAEIADTNLRNRTGAVGRVLRQMRPELIPDVTQDPDYVVNRPRTVAQITVPIVAQDQLVGVLNLETNAAGVFTEEKFDFIKLIVGRMAAALDNARLHRRVEAQLEQLKILYEQVSQLEQMKTDMIRIASHDLRNPLSSILGFLEMLGWDIDALDNSERLHEQVEQIEKAAHRMEKIIADILSLERIEEMAQQMTHVRFDLRDLVTQTYHDHTAQADLAGQTMTIDIPDEPVYVEGDPVQLAEAMANLLSNAIKYTRTNGTIRLRLYGEGGRAVYEVQDDGIGIRKEQQDRLFQPFYRARSSETLNIEGTGLGLHLVKNIVERHGGKMRFTSEYGRGSTFGFQLRRMYQDGA